MAEPSTLNRVVYVRVVLPHFTITKDVNPVQSMLVRIQHLDPFTLNALVAQLYRAWSSYLQGHRLESC